MKFLRRIFGILTPAEAFAVQVGLDPHYRSRKVRHDGLTFQRISWTETEAKFPFRDDRIKDRHFFILLSEVDQVSQLHRKVIQKIRENLKPLFGSAVEAIFRILPPDEQDFRALARRPTIMLGVDCGEFDGTRWAMVFSWGEGDFGYHVEFKDMKIVDVWCGD